MAPYFALVALAGALALLSQAAAKTFAKVSADDFTASTTDPRAVNRRWTFFDYVLVLVIVSFSALRYEVGTDYSTSSGLYEALDPQYWVAQLAASPLEIGYTAFSLALRSFSEDPHLIFWSTSVLTVIPIYATIKKQSYDVPLAVMLYILFAFFVGPFNIIRQGIAIALSFWAASFFEKNKVAFGVINGIAVLFHASALIAIIVQLVVRLWRPKPRTLVITVIVGVAVFSQLITLPLFIDVVTALIPRYAYYVGDDTQRSGIGAYLVAAAHAGLLLYVIFVNRTNDKSRRYIDPSWLTFVAVGVFFLVVATFSVVAGRPAGYFTIFMLLLIPNQLATRPQAVSKSILLVSAVLYFAFYLSNYGGLVPYQTYL